MSENTDPMSDLLNRRTSRRGFLRVTASALLPQEPKPDPQFLLRKILMEIQQRAQQADLLNQTLAEFKTPIEEFNDAFKVANPITQLKTFSPQEWLNSMGMYAPMYVTTGADYDIDPMWLPIIHAQETALSTGGLANGSLVGAMQRHAPSWSEQKMNHLMNMTGRRAVTSREYLGLLPQRSLERSELENDIRQYSQLPLPKIPELISSTQQAIHLQREVAISSNSSDWWEIRFAGAFLRYYADQALPKFVFANNSPLSNGDQLIASAMMRYCAPRYAHERITVFTKMKVWQAERAISTTN